MRTNIVRYGRRRLFYFACAALTIVPGLATRRQAVSLPGGAGKYAGDALWALMVFFGDSAIRSRHLLALDASCALLPMEDRQSTTSCQLHRTRS